MDTFNKMMDLQVTTTEVRNLLIKNLLQFNDAKVTNTADMTFEIVLGYLSQASEDAVFLASAMLSRYSTPQTLSLMTEVSDHSTKEFYRAFNQWKAQYVN